MDMPDALEKLHRLYKAGAMSASDYENAKRAILSGRSCSITIEDPKRARFVSTLSELCSIVLSAIESCAYAIGIGCILLTLISASKHDGRLFYLAKDLTFSDVFPLIALTLCFGALTGISNKLPEPSAGVRWTWYFCMVIGGGLGAAWGYWYFKTVMEPSWSYWIASWVTWLFEGQNGIIPYGRYRPLAHWMSSGLILGTGIGIAFAFLFNLFRRK